VPASTVRDDTEQWLALTNRTWVPPMNYSSTAPWPSCRMTSAPVTDLRRLPPRGSGELSVAELHHHLFQQPRDVEGGTLNYKANLPNIGVVWRSAAAGRCSSRSGKGFSLPNVGIPLRNIN
jgi:iron complex outermembrane receptor protein